MPHKRIIGYRNGRSKLLTVISMSKLGGYKISCALDYPLSMIFVSPYIVDQEVSYVLLLKIATFQRMDI